MGFPGGLLVKTPCFQCRVWGFDSLVGEGPTLLSSVAKKKREKEEKIVQQSGSVLHTHMYIQI